MTESSDVHTRTEMARHQNWDGQKHGANTSGSDVEIVLERFLLITETMTQTSSLLHIHADGKNEWADEVCAYSIERSVTQRSRQGDTRV